ncbi:MAG: hypothetical protein ABII00_00835 [Elusimicrobiota bacterium]
MKTRSLLGWVILLGALAVPAVFFWSWWTKMQTETTFEVKQRVPEGSAFGDVRTMPAEGVPGSEEPGQGAPPADGGEEDAADDAMEPGDEAPEPEEDAAGATPDAGAAAPPSGTPEAGQGAEAPGEPPATAVPVPADDAGGRDASMDESRERIEYSPKTTRDPTLSLADLRELAKMRLAKMKARAEVQKALQPKPKKEKKVIVRQRSICERIELQGIVATPNGIAALVNDNVMKEGDEILGAVIKRITTRTVVFGQGRRTLCVKRVQK